MREIELPVRKKILGLAFALILALTTYAPALAHECIIASRSEAGNLAAAKSANWVSVRELFVLFGGFLHLPALSEAQLDWAVSEAAAQGVPSDLAIFARFTLLEGTPADNPTLMSNGVGVDHTPIFDYFNKILAIYQQALTK